VKGKPWSAEHEKKLKEWVTSGVSVDALVFNFDLANTLRMLSTKKWSG
jgi:hypothetical protein